VCVAGGGGCNARKATPRHTHAHTHSPIVHPLVPRPKAGRSATYLGTTDTVSQLPKHVRESGAVLGKAGGKPGHPEGGLNRSLTHGIDKSG
jgi:hypothetical protein